MEVDFQDMSLGTCSSSMKKSQIVKLILFPVLLTGALLGLNFGLFAQVNDELTSYGQFYKEEEKCLDVVMVGNSTMREGFVPTHFWHEYGYTSRTFSASPTHPEVIINAISQIIRFQEPKVIFIDLNGLTYQERKDSEFFIKQYYKALPSGEFKDELLTKYSYLKEVDEEVELFKNHNNFRQQQYWETLVYPGQFEAKGYYANDVYRTMTAVEPDQDKTVALPEDGEYYLQELVKECQKYLDTTTFIFGRTPRYNIIEKDLNATYMFRTIKQEIEGTGIIFADFSLDPVRVGLNTICDFKDNNHLSHVGAKKFTDYFASYMKDELGILPKEKKQSTIDNFNHAYEVTKDHQDGIENDIKKKAGQL